MVAKLIPFVCALACGASATSPKGAPQPPFLVKIEFPVAQADGTTSFERPSDVLDETRSAVQVIRAASVRIEILAEQRPSIQGPGLFPAEAVTGSIDELRKLRDADEGFYRVENMTPGPATAPTPKWTIVFEPPSFALLGRTFLFTVHTGAVHNHGLPFRLLFVPPGAPTNLAFRTDNISLRAVDWVDPAGSTTGFEIVESLTFGGVREVIGSVPAGQTSFETDDRLPDGSISADVRSFLWQVCSRPASPGSVPRCSLPVNAKGRRVAKPPCSSGIPMPLAAVQSADNPTLFKVGTSNLATVIAVTNPSAFAIEVRSRGTSYVPIPANGKVTWSAGAENLWTVRLPSTTNPLPAALQLSLEICP